MNVVYYYYYYYDVVVPACYDHYYYYYYCKATSEYRKRVRRVLRSKLSSKNKVTAINTFAVPVILYPAAVVTCRREDLKETDIGTRKLMTMHGVFHPKSSTARLYISRKEGGRGLHSIEKFYTKKNRA